MNNVDGGTFQARSGETGLMAREAALIASLDVIFQDAVKRNDAELMAEILHEEAILVLGDGTVISREEQLRGAADRETEYEVQDEEPGTQSVRVWGDTAVVTARLSIKGRRAGAGFERRLWFSDIYIRTKEGWRYAFGQASLPLSAD
jgi:ketosteroid isomerase-like protein